jgi:hypothetical protein
MKKTFSQTPMILSISVSTMSSKQYLPDTSHKAHRGTEIHKGDLEVKRYE